MALTVGKKLTLNTALFSLVAIIPFVILSIMAVSTARDSFISGKFEQLVSIRGIKKAQVKKFFAERQSDMGVLVETVGSLRKEAFSKLEAIQMIKKAQVESYFGERLGDAEVLSHSRDVYHMFEVLTKYHEDTNVQATGAYDVSTAEYQALYKENSEFLNNYNKIYGYYDTFIICAKHGHVMYSASKESDLGTNLGYGEHKNSPLAKLWRKVVKTNEIALQDFEPYAPSNNEPFAFVGAPIKKNGNTIGVVAMQLPLDAINKIMQERTGLGKTGEVYLVGADKLMRSDSYLYPTNHTVKASFANPDKGSVDTDAAREALAGKGGAKVIIDYNGNPVLSAYDPVKIHGLQWAIIAEIDVAEAFCPVDKNGSEFFAKYTEIYGYYDLFLINPDGYIFYTATRESDYQTNLVSGKYSSSGLGKLVRQVLETKQIGFADFEPYAPSNGEPAAFIAQPIVHDGKIEAVVALQLSLEAINSIMQQREGLGRTGETYLIGTDKLMRSDSYLNSVSHSVKASFSNPIKGGVDTEASQEALAGKTGEKIVIDYNGNPVLSAYTPVKIGGTTWAMLAEIDKKEVVRDSVAARNLLHRVWMIGFISMVIVLTMVVFSVFIVKNLSGTLRNVIGGLNTGADQVASASSQVSSASQQLAEGASEQAASIEEISSSLEEISSMTKQNADNAGQADNLMKEANQVVDQANESMTALTSSMEEITRASEETSKIIKTIDEVAFQTNLLALNAAVEAARAGEAGAGFAVVADEVRNLAIRSADAAKNTASLIEGTVKKVSNGSRLVTKTDKAFTEVAVSAKKVGELVGEISAASTEQAEGIEQVNKAVVEMDKVVQQNAANAEESASASEEMNAQAEQMKSSVGELLAMVGKSGNEKTQAVTGLTKSVHYKTHNPEKMIKQMVVHKENELRPEQVIPMDDCEDFKDF